ncbi:TonB-dependent receptor [Croceicoccus naphthovorans]|uniref:TonB-dependent receptor n=1 Tax=Croceicoccus naphthovorans TaxID=1348774 RepID=A0A0G3XLL1_9SPHN|nr:TonB-dependent receptor [Croceicoccus naphthovorans]AKM11504.1 TonB-dependent receptor [Croceicoccus naphthovorans]
MCIAGVVITAPALAQDAGQTIVVTAPGGAFDLDDALALERADIAVAGVPDVLGAMTRNFAGVTLQDAQNNPWQPNLVDRGYVASPLQGQAQGIAVYLDGARFNQPFGDTVNFDLIPDAAIRALTMRDAGPVYGLNALGGVLVMETMTGRDDPGVEAAAAIGSYGERDLSASAGSAFGRFSAFGAVQYREEDGWRDYSPSDLLNGYVDVGFEGERGGAHLKFIGAETNLTGNGVAPVELLAARRQSVFTWPDRTNNRYGRFSLHPWLALSDGMRLEATLYRQRRKADTANGDAADIEECEEEEFEGLLCLESVGDDDDEAQTVLTDREGNAIADLLDDGEYGVFNRGRIKTRSEGILAQLIAETPMGARTNRLAAGFSYDSSESAFSTSTELGELTDTRSVNGLAIFIDQPDGAIAPVGLKTRTRYWSAFVGNSLPLGGALTAEIGLRYNHAKVRLVDQIGTALNGKHRFSRLNPGIELDWALSPTVSLRAGYSETNRVPTPAELSCADEDAPCSLTNFFIADPPLEQVVAKTFELGATGEIAAGAWDVDWLLSGYRTTNTNDIQYIASAIRGRAYFQNVGSTRRQGVEATLQARRGGLRLSASYAFIDATYRSPLTLSSPANPEADDDGEIYVAPGDRLPGLPQHSGTFSADFQGRGFTLGGDMVARGSQGLIGDEADQNAPVPGYLLFNLRGSLDLTRGISLFGELRNVFDRDNATFGTFSEVDEVELEESPDASDPRAYGPGAPRRWTLGVRARF